MGSRRACSPHLPVVRREAFHTAITRRWNFFGEPADNGERLGQPSTRWLDDSYTPGS
jgi:hypothetical protein